MLSLTNSISQSPLSGQALTFDTVLINSGCAECFQKDTGVPQLVMRNAMYEIDFSCNVSASAEGLVEAALAINGTAIPYSLMQTSIAAADNVAMISRKLRVKTCCCPESISVLNMSASTVTPSFSEPVLNIKRVA